MAVKKIINKPEQSKNFAWFLGALAGDGYVNQKNGSVKLIVTQKDFSEKFQNIGEYILKTNSCYYYRPSKKPNHSDVHEIAFYSVDLVNWIGDFKGDTWHKTVKEKYTWVLEKKEYKIAFLNGYFDSEGSVQDVSKSKRADKIRCRISIGYWKPAYFLQELLNSLDIKSNFYIRPSTGIVKDIVITGTQNVIKFCNLIDSSIDYKQKRINYIRKIKIIDSTDFIKKLYARYKELIKNNSPQIVYNKLIHEGYGDNEHYKLTKYKVRNWTYIGHNPLNTDGHHNYKIIFP